jgi:hypothetical protein
MVGSHDAGIVSIMNPLIAVTGAEIGTSIHVIGAIAGVGPLFVQPLLMSYLRKRETASIGGVMVAMLWINRALVTPGLTILLVAGLYLVGNGQGEFSEPWVSFGLAAVIVMLGLVGAVIMPRLRRGAELAESDQITGDEFSRNSQILGFAWWGCVLLAVVAVFLMYIQPS